MEGISGPGFKLDEGERLDYEMKGNFDVCQGSLSLWIQPVNWHGNDRRFHHRPDIVQSFENGKSFDAVIIGPGSFYTSLLPIFLVQGAREAVQAARGPVILVANLLTEGRGMRGFTVGEAVRRLTEAMGRQIDVVIANGSVPSEQALEPYASEHKLPLEIGDLPSGCQLVVGDFWSRDIARHDRQRLAYAVWGVLAQRLLAS